VLYVKFLFLIIFFVHGMTYLVGNWKIDWKIFLQYSKVATCSAQTNDIDLCEEIYVLESRKDGSVKMEIVPKEFDPTVLCPLLLDKDHLLSFPKEEVHIRFRQESLCSAKTIDAVSAELFPQGLDVDGVQDLQVPR
jgi:hypothetical protein